MQRHDFASTLRRRCKTSCASRGALILFAAMPDYTYLFQYKLETFTEGRTTKKKKKPYKGGPVDGPENGPAPMPWEINCPPKSFFKDDKIKKEVPHTAKVKVCRSYTFSHRTFVMNL